MTPQGIVSHPRFDLSGAKQYQANLIAAFALWEAQNGIYGDDIVLSVEPDPDRHGRWLFRMPDGSIVGLITSRQKVGAILAAGRAVARAQVCNIGHEKTRDDLIVMRVQVWTGEPGQVYSPPVEVAKSYLVPVVGEQYHLKAIAGCKIGSAVSLVHELGNPFDDNALAVFLTSTKQKIGYIPKDHWFRRAVVEDGNGCVAFIFEIHNKRKSFRHIVLHATLQGRGVGSCKYEGMGSQVVRTSNVSLTIAIVLGFVAILLAWLMSRP